MHEPVQDSNSLNWKFYCLLRPNKRKIPTQLFSDQNSPAFETQSTMAPLGIDFTIEKPRQ